MAYDYDKVKLHLRLVAKAKTILRNRHLEEYSQILKELEEKNETKD